MFGRVRTGVWKLRTQFPTLGQLLKTTIMNEPKTTAMENLSVSLFKGYRDTVPTEVSLKTIVEMIRSHEDVARHTERYRHYLQQQLSKPAALEKESCPCFAVSVRFSGGKRKEDVCGYTGLCMADFDHVAPERLAACLEAVRRDPHTLLAYVTISKGGFRVISRYALPGDLDTERPGHLHSLAFAQTNHHYAELTGCPYDEKCKNITRLSGLAHDPDVYFNPDAEPFLVTANPDGRQDHQPTRTEKRLARVVRAIEKQLEKEGVAYVAHHHNEYVMRTGYLLNAYGIPLQAAIRWGVDRFADYDGDVAGVFRSCYQQTDEHGTRTLGSRRKARTAEAPDENTVAAMEAFLATKGPFRKNTITGKCEVSTDGGETYADLTDRHVNSYWREMCRTVMNVRQADLHAMLASDLVEQYNPFESYLQSLPAWDGTSDPIGDLAAQVHVTVGAELFPGFFKKWLVAMVASLLHPEVVNHEILVLIGRQGIYKTTWLNNLLPPELRRYFYLKSNSRHISKDDLLTLSEFAIVCLEELDELDGRELNQIKALTTMRSINERAAYAHYKEVRTHIASYCGTGNNIHFLTDLTGNRRWMPFEVEGIDNPYTHPLDYKAIYAQAYALVQQGFAYWLNDEELRQLNEHNRYFETPCLERDLILTYYQRPMEGEECVFLTCAQILSRLNAGLRLPLSATKVGTVMSQEGFQRMRVGGKRGYRVVELSGEQIEFRKRSVTRWT